MKKLGSQTDRIIFLVLLACLLLVGICRGVHLDTSFFSLFPEYSNLAEVEKRIARNSASSVFILAEGADFSTARRGAQAFYDTFQNSFVFKNLSLYQDEDSMEVLKTFLFEHRYQLLDDETLSRLENGNADAVSQEALAQVYSPFSFADLSLLDKDPFLLTAKNIRKYASQGTGNLFLKEGVLAAESDGLWYVLIRGRVTDDALSFSGRNGIGKMYEQLLQLENSNPGVSYICSGVPFHSYESSSKAMKEISWITGVSLALVALILLIAFRTLLPMLVSVVNIGISLLAGFAVTLILYGKIHALALVFGTTLIGVSIDYSIHYFLNRDKIFRSLTVNCISTEISWCLLMLAPFPLLRQVALFSAAGLACSYFIVRLIYPVLPDIRQSDKSHQPCRAHIVRLTGILVMIVCLVAPALCGIRIKNSIRGMYTMSGKLLEWEKKAGTVMNLGSSGEYFIVAGTDQQELLVREERLAAELEKAVKNGSIGAFSRVTAFVPSEARQKRSYQAAGALLPCSRPQLEALGFGSSARRQFEQEYRNNIDNFVTIDTVPPYIKENIEALFLGNVGGTWYSVVFPLQVKDGSALSSLADGKTVFFLSKIKDIEKELDHLTRTALLFVLISYFLVFSLLCLVYRRRALRIVLVPASVILGTLSFVSVSSGGVDLFACSGIVMIFGLGLDYLVYGLEGKSGKATLLSFITTEISFGALALSSFVPAHVFGLTVCAGLALAYLLSLSVDRS